MHTKADNGCVAIICNDIILTNSINLTNLMEKYTMKNY